jgi:hypothetical protein
MKIKFRYTYIYLGVITNNYRATVWQYYFLDDASLIRGVVADVDDDE